MPAHLRWLEDARTMLVSHYGTVDADDLHRTDKGALEQCEPKGPDVCYVADFRRATIDLTTEDVIAHATRMNEHDFWTRIPGLRVAMIVDRPRETAFGMLFNTVASDAGMQIFSTAEGAWEHLGLEPELLARHVDLIPAWVGNDD